MLPPGKRVPVLPPPLPPSRAPAQPPGPGGEQGGVNREGRTGKGEPPPASRSPGRGALSAGGGAEARRFRAEGRSRRLAGASFSPPSPPRTPREAAGCGLPLAPLPSLFVFILFYFNLTPLPPSRAAAAARSPPHFPPHPKIPPHPSLPRHGDMRSPPAAAAAAAPGMGPARC